MDASGDDGICIGDSLEGSCGSPEDDFFRNESMVRIGQAMVVSWKFGLDGLKEEI